MIFLVVVVIILYVGFFRFVDKGNGLHGLLGQQTRRSTRREDTGSPVTGVAAADSEAEHLAWTALDDLQLNRLLRDSW